MPWLWSWFPVVPSWPSDDLLRSVRCQNATAGDKRVAQRARFRCGCALRFSLRRLVGHSPLFEIAMRQRLSESRWRPAAASGVPPSSGKPSRSAGLYRAAGNAAARGFRGRALGRIATDFGLQLDDVDELIGLAAQLIERSSAAVSRWWRLH